jgi:hypothetical protein
VIVVEDGAMQLMKVGPSESPCGGRLQTASCCAGREAGVVSDEEKAPVRRQVGTRKANVSESLTTCRDDYPPDIETEASGCPRDEPGGCPRIGQVVSGMKATRAWSAAAVWNVGRPAPIRPPDRAAIGRPPSSRNCEVPSTDAGSVGGLARSSAEAPVMGVERRGQAIVRCSSGQPRRWEEPR